MSRWHRKADGVAVRQARARNKTRHCSVCGKPGHNARTCQEGANIISFIDFSCNYF
jgi:hypothetical protein